MALASINVRVEPEAKLQFEDFCNQIGMSMSTAINVFIKAVLREKKSHSSLPQSRIHFTARKTWNV